LQNAEDVLGRALGGPVAGEAPPARKAESGPASPEAPGRAGLASGDPCFTACRALASMERAATHLCELTGDGDTRCSNARTRVKTAPARVRSSCPVCQAH